MGLLYTKKDNKKAQLALGFLALLNNRDVITAMEKRSSLHQDCFSHPSSVGG